MQNEREMSKQNVTTYRGDNKVGRVVALAIVWGLCFVIAFISIGVVYALHATTRADVDDGSWQYQGLGAMTHFDGEGTVDNPFLIANAGQLALLARRVNEEGYTFDGIYGHFLLVNDINLQLRHWVAIGNFGNPFMGTFDGGFHTITLPNRIIAHVEPFGTGGIGRWGLFGYTQNATIRNLFLAGNVTQLWAIDNETITTAYVGMLVGQSIGESTIENIVNRANLGAPGNTATCIDFGLGATLVTPHGQTATLTSNRFGGVIGSVSHHMVLRNVSNYGAVSHSTAQASGGIIGGAIGTSYSPVSVEIFNSYNRGAINAQTNNPAGTHGGAGGLVGLNSFSSLRIVNSFNIGPVFAPVNPNVSRGAIIGRNDTSVNLHNVLANAHPCGIAVIGGMGTGATTSQSLVANMDENGYNLLNWVFDSPVESRQATLFGQMTYGLTNTNIITAGQRSLMAGWVASVSGSLIPMHNFDNYTVIFNTMGAPFAVPTQAVFEGLPITPPDMNLPQFRWPGHEFMFWTDRMGGDVNFFATEQIVNRNLTLYAVWQVGRNQVTLNFTNISQGINLPALVMTLPTADYVVGSNHLPVPQLPDGSDRVFLGWAATEAAAAQSIVLNNWSGYWRVGNTVTVAAVSTDGSGNPYMILWAVYRQLHRDCPLTLDCDYRELNIVLASPAHEIGQAFGTLVEDAILHRNMIVNTAPIMNILMPNVPQVPGFTFQGWATSRENADRSIISIRHDEPVIMYDPGHVITRTIYAVWNNLRTAQIVFHISDQFVDGGRNININVAPLYSAFATGQMLGWSLDEAFGVDWVPHPDGPAMNHIPVVLRGPFNFGPNNNVNMFGLPEGVVFVGWALSPQYREIFRDPDIIASPDMMIGVGESFFLNRHMELFAVFRTV